MASPVDTSVKFAYAEMAGAPLLSGTAGSLISVLDAFLINGFGLKTVDSGSITNGVCRLEFSSGVSCADVNAVILVSGATPAGLNGEQKVTAFSSSWVEFKTALPDGAVTGAVSFKLAPLGWEKVFSKTNVAVYRPTDPAGTRPFIRIDDTSATFARVRMYEAMTDVDTGVGMAPSEASVAGGYVWWKRATAVATGCHYVLAGDSRGVLVAINANVAAGATSAGFGAVGYYAGDINSFRSGDAYCAYLTGAASTTFSGGSGYGSVFTYLTSQPQSRTLARTSGGLGGSVSSLVFAGGASDSGANILGPGASQSNNGLFFIGALVSDGPDWSRGVRGSVPGVSIALNSGLSALFPFTPQQTRGHGTFQNRTLLSFYIHNASNQSSSITAGSICVGFVDITGPWREA